MSFYRPPPGAEGWARADIGDRRHEGHALGNLGIAHWYMNELDKAKAYQLQWLTIAREIHDRRDESYALGNLGILSKNIGELDEALNYYSQTLAIAEELFDPTGEANAFWNMALLYKEKSEMKQAAKLARKALKIYDQTGDHNAIMVGNALKNWRKLNKQAKPVEIV